MSENLHDIDKLFRDSIEGHEEVPPGKVWDAIDNNLDKSNVIQIKRKYNNLKRLAIALLLLLMGTIVYEIQSKKTGKGEVATSTSNSNKENNTSVNNAAGKTTTNNTVNKLNGGSSDQTVINGSSSNNTVIDNAGKDAGKDILPNTTAQDDQSANPKKANCTQQSYNKTAIKAPKIKDGQDVVNEGALLQQAIKLQVKKSYSRKTKITIKNGVAAEETVADDNETEKNAVNKTISKSATPAANNELKGLTNTKAEKITGTFIKNSPLQINDKRKSPDAALAATGAKSKAAKNTRSFHFSIMPFYSPQYSTNRLEDDHHDPGPQQGNGRDAIKRDEPSEKVYSFGVLATVPVGKKWSLQSGITYLDKEINIEPKKIYAKLDNDGKVKYRFDCSSGYTYISPKSGTTPAVGDSIYAAASTNNLQYLGIPLAVNYTFSLGKFSIIPTVGATINFLTKQKIETELIQGTTNEKQSISTIEGLKKNYFSAFTGIALEYNLSKRIALNLTPSGNFALSSINKDAAVKSYPNSFGVAAGIKIKF